MSGIRHSEIDLCINNPSSCSWCNALHTDAMQFWALEGSCLCRQQTARRFAGIWDEANGMCLHSGPRPAPLCVRSPPSHLWCRLLLYISISAHPWPPFWSVSCSLPPGGVWDVTFSVGSGCADPCWLLCHRKLIASGFTEAQGAGQHTGARKITHLMLRSHT